MKMELLIAFSLFAIVIVIDICDYLIVMNANKSVFFNSLYLYFYSKRDWKVYKMLRKMTDIPIYTEQTVHKMQPTGNEWAYIYMSNSNKPVIVYRFGHDKDQHFAYKPLVMKLIDASSAIAG